MQAINRRTFLAGSAATGLGVAALGLSACSSSSESDDTSAESTDTTEETTTTSYDPAETVECDLVVVGSGNSGMSACLEAIDQGLSVVLLEKESYLGGTLIGTEGLMGLGSQLQIDAGTELPETYELVNEELEYTNYRVDPLLWKEVIDASGEDIDWLMEKGVTFPTVDNYLDQSAYDTFHWWEGGTGSVAAETLGALVQEEGVDVRLSTPAVDLKTEDGAVVGVYAETEDGDILEVDAKAVLLATGGLANDLELLGEKTGLDMTDAQSLFPINEVGDGLAMATSVGALESSISILNVFSVRNYSPTDVIAVAPMQPNCLYVNEDGTRFMDESLAKKKYFALVYNAFNVQKAAYAIMSQNVVDTLENDGCAIGVASVKTGDPLTGLSDQLEEAVATDGSCVYKGETIEELASAMGLDADALVATVDAYNALCSEGADADFGKDAEHLEALSDGPFYAVSPVLSVFQTIGGITINRDMQVLDESGEVIEGLYSSGVASCGLYKETYCYQVSGGMNCYCTYTGRKAAQVIAASI